MRPPGKIILALPAYNEAENLRPLLEAASAVFNRERYAFQIVIVDDGSTDATAAVLEVAAADPQVQVIRHPLNRGLGEAILSGLRASLDHCSPSRPDIIVCMDADNTHDPAYIPEMASRIWESQYDVVIASRFQSGSAEVGVPFPRRVLSRGARLLFQLFLRLPEVRDYTCGYRAYRAAVIQEAFKKYEDRLITRRGFACTDELLVKLSTLTKGITEIPFVLRYDQKRSRSKLPLFRTIWETLKMLLFHR